MTHYFKAKIKKLQEDVEELQNDVKKKVRDVPSQKYDLCEICLQFFRMTNVTD